MIIILNTKPVELVELVFTLTRLYGFNLMLQVTIKGATVKSFLALLVFLYTDDVPSDMTINDYRELLVVADRFCLPQLISVCESAITEKIYTEIRKKRLNSAKCNDVINLLLTGQVGV